LAIDKYDNIYVADPQSDPGCSLEASVKKFDNNGKFITSWRILRARDSEAESGHLVLGFENKLKYILIDFIKDSQRITIKSWLSCYKRNERI
jgi:hypothetical protein